MTRSLAHIRRVDIEYQSFCNRKCDWCPNKTLLRDKSIKMSDELYTNILHQLKESHFGEDDIPFSGIEGMKGALSQGTARLSFLGYQEPLSCPDLFKRRVKEAYDTLSGRVRIVSNTNGDYLNKESLENLMLTNLAIMDYDNKGKDYWMNKLKELDILPIDFDEKTETINAIHRYVNSVSVSCNWSKHDELQNRGGYFKQGDLPQYKWKLDMRPRTIPCPEAEYYINISYDGSVMPCCHMRPDNPEHQQYILGNVNEQSIVDIYYSQKAEEFREKMRHENGDFPEPCKYCQKIREENCTGSPSGWNYMGLEYYRKIKKEEAEKKEVVQRINEEWTKEQLDAWDSVKNVYVKYKDNDDGKIYTNSIYNIENMIFINNEFNVQLFKDLYNYYIENLKAISNVYYTKYVDLDNDLLVDYKGDISFDNFAFTNEQISNEISTIGMYQPFCAYSKRKPGYLGVCSGRHRLKSLKYLHDNNIPCNKKYLCIVLDSHKNDFSCNIIFPKILYNRFFQKLNMNKTDYNGEQYLITVDNIVDLWLVIKLQEKELNFVVEKYENFLIENGIVPSNYININKE